MGKQLQFEYKDKEYVLQYTRNTEKVMESWGFDINAIQSKPQTMIPLLFKGAFLLHHKRIEESLVNEIWDNIGNKSALLGALTELYAEPLNTLFDEETEGKVSWVVI